MNSTIIILTPLLLTLCAYAEIEHDHHYDKKDNFLFMREQLNHKAKPVIATTSIGLGTYLLYDTIQTAIDLQGTEQQNSKKGMIPTAIVAAGLITAGAYLWKQVWDDNKSSTKN